MTMITTVNIRKIRISWKELNNYYMHYLVLLPCIHSAIFIKKRDGKLRADRFVYTYFEHHQRDNAVTSSYRCTTAVYIPTPITILSFTIFIGSVDSILCHVSPCRSWIMDIFLFNLLLSIYIHFTFYSLR